MKTRCTSVQMLAAAFAFAVTTIHSSGASHMWSGAVSGNWSVPGNWSSGGAPASGESPLHVSFPSGTTRLATTNDIPGLYIDSITITADGYLLVARPGAGITLKGSGLSVIGNGSATFDTSIGITLNGYNYFHVATGKLITLDSAIDGSGLLAKIGPGTLRLRSAGGNTYNGGTLVNDGTLLLECGGVAVPGVVNIGTTNKSMPASVKLAAPEQIANGAPITIYPSGRIDLNGFAETVGPMTFTGGGVYGNAGSLLTLNGDVTGLFWLGVADLQAPISLGGTNRTFITGIGSTIVVNSIADGGQAAGLIKVGPGSLLLAASNSYNGMTLVNEGNVAVLDNNALGSTNAGTVVANGATLRMEGTTAVGAEPLALNGMGVNDVNGALQSGGVNVWSGPITLMTDADVMVGLNHAQLTLSGQISGTGALRKTGLGPLTFSGPEPNVYTNTTLVTEGLLKLGKPQHVNAIAGPLVVGDPNDPLTSGLVILAQHNQIADTSSVTLNTNGVLDCFNWVDYIGALLGHGSVQTGSGQLNAGDDDSDFTFHGTIGGTGTIVFNKIGTGTMTLAGAITSGGSQLASGRLIVNGQHPGPIKVIGPMSLAGTGLLGDLRFTGSGLLRPGSFFGNTPGVLTSGALSLTNSSVLMVELFGTDAGTGYDQVDVAGAVNVTGSKLRVRLGAAMPSGSQFVLIRNDGVDAVTGTFDGLPEGATFTTNTIQFRISYQGGDGNDVVLTQITTPPELRVESIRKTLSGHMRVTGNGVPGFTYQVQASTDLNSTNWIILGSLVASTNGNFVLTDTNWLSYPMRFYRFVQ